MSFQSKSHPGRVLAMPTAMIAVLCAFATFVAAQDQPAPKWELYGGYSLFHPGADVRPASRSIAPVEQPPGSESARRWRQPYL